MAINKIIVDGVTKIDLTQDTVTADKVLEGMTFHDATGSLCTGTMKAGADVGDLPLYTKYAYNYDDYISNGSSFPSITVYDEDHSSIQFWFVIKYAGGTFEMSYDNPNLRLQDDTVYVVSTTKISSVDVNFGGAYGS